MRTVTAHKAILRGKVRWRVIEPASKDNPKPVQRWFKTKEKADAHALKINAGRANRIDELFTLDRQSQSLLVEALRKAGSAHAVLEAVNSVGTPVQPKTIREAIDALIDDRNLAERSDHYLTQLKWTLEKFATGRERAPINTVTADDVRAWLNDIGGSADVKRSYISRVRGLFAFAIQNKWTRENPAKSVSMPGRGKSEPKILTPDDVARLFKAALSEPETITCYALLFFAGMRPSEVARLKPEHFTPDYIRVPIEVARKKKEVRNIPMFLLGDWLRVGRIGSRENFARPTVPRNWRKLFRKVNEAAGVTWSQDVARHSFVTYCSKIHGWEKTVEWAGHSLAMMVEHYKAMATEAEARKFFEITPAALVAENLTKSPIR